MSKDPQPCTKLTPEALTRLIDESFPQIHANGRIMTIESVADRSATVRLTLSARSTRPGGTISGPAMFTLADFAIYVALLGELGPAAVPSVTSNLNITFLSRPAARDMIGHARLVRVGRRLAYAEVELFSDGEDEMVAHATGTYAIVHAKPADPR